MTELWMKANSANLMFDIGRILLEGFANSGYPSKAFSSVGAVEMEETVQIPAPTSTRMRPIDARKRVR